MKKLIFAFTTITAISASIYANTILTIGEREKSDIDYMPSNDVQDTIEIPQDPTQFADQAEYMSAQEQLDYDAKYNEKFFEPWNMPNMGLNEGEKTWQFMFAKRKMYRRYGERIPKKWFQDEIKNSNFSEYESINRPAIIVKHSDLKLYPTDEEFFYSISKTGEGFPFDYNQNSSVYVNTPIRVSHFSKDKKWAYIKTAFAFGWVKVENIAFVSLEFQNKFQTPRYAIATTDNLKLIDDGEEISLIKLGTIFPMNVESNEYFVALKDEKGYAYLKKVEPQEVNIIAKKPIKFNKFNISFIGKQLIGEPYGWGGKLKTRDCSTLTRDFFAPFGIYLPRNSKQQAQSGEYISLKGMSEKEKESAILAYGRPCRSLLVVPGHVTIYLGQKNGEPIIMHNYWGVRLKNGTKRILGRSVITTTKIGKELPDINRKSMLINTFKGLVNF
jgi:cell wall-associated NlpC family hydrolase